MKQNNEQESTWETEELIRWIINDEGLYYAAQEAIRRLHPEPAAALEAWAEEIDWSFLGDDFDWKQVDWDEVASSLAGDE